MYFVQHGGKRCGSISTKQEKPEASSTSNNQEQDTQPEGLRQAPIEWLRPDSLQIIAGEALMNVCDPDYVCCLQRSTFGLSLLRDASVSFHTELDTEILSIADCKFEGQSFVVGSPIGEVTVYEISEDNRF
jgi:hypothetical protein